MPKISILTPTIRPEGLNIIKECLQRQTFTDFEWLVEVGLPKKDGHDLNKAFNKMLKRAQGELIVFLEDYTKILDNGLENFWNAYQKNPDTFFTAPLGKVDNLEFKGKAKWDWRAYEDAKCIWRTWEIDWACAPKEALFKIGGFDEALDGDLWSCDNVNVGKRAQLAGYKFDNLFSNPAQAFDHDAFMEHPFRHQFKPLINEERMKSFEEGFTIDYLH